MTLTIKILLTLTFLATIVKRWTVVTAVATLSIVTDRSPLATPVMRKDFTQLTGTESLKALGATVWMATLGTLMWIWL